jgi:hypothetical protein
MWLKRAAKLESDLLEQQKNVPDEVQKLPVVRAMADMRGRQHD